jgi:protein TonB
LLLHFGTILSLLDEFPRPAPPQPEPIPVELALAPPEPPEPVEPEPLAAQRPVPDRRSGGELEDVAPGERPPSEPPPSEETPEVTETPPASPEPAPTPPLPPAEKPTEALPPPAVAPAPQQTVLAPVPPAKPKPPAPAAKPASAEPQPQAEAAPSHTVIDPGQGGGDRYLNAVRDDILAHMVYPPTAELFRLGGIATYEIVIDREGKLLRARLAESSGLALLDNAGLQTIRLAAPFDPVPDDIPGKTVGFILRLTMGPGR